jgi:hypothetical protein
MRPAVAITVKSALFWSFFPTLNLLLRYFTHKKVRIWITICALRDKLLNSRFDCRCVSCLTGWNGQTDLASPAFFLFSARLRSAKILLWSSDFLWHWHPVFVCFLCADFSKINPARLTSRPPFEFTPCGCHTSHKHCKSQFCKWPRLWIHFFPGNAARRQFCAVSFP